MNENTEEDTEVHAQKDHVPPHAVRRRRGIYILPNLFTTAALFAGFSFTAILMLIVRNKKHVEPIYNYKV